MYLKVQAFKKARKMEIIDGQLRAMPEDYKCTVGKWLAYGPMRAYMEHVENCKQCKNDLQVINLKKQIWEIANGVISEWESPDKQPEE